MIRRSLGTLATIGLLWACRAPPHEDQQAATDSLGLPAYATSVSPDSNAVEALPPELAPLVGPQAKARTGDLDSIVARRIVRVLITPTRTQYWIDQGKQIGAEYEMLRAFDDWLNQKYPAKRRHQNIFLVYIPVSRDELIPGLLAGRGDIAAGILTITPERLAVVDAGGPFYSGVKELLVSGPNSPAVTTLDDLAGQQVVVRQSSSYWSHLEELNARFAREGLRPISLEAAPEDLADDDLLEMVNAGLIGTTVVDRYAALLWRQILPDLRVHEDIPVHEGGEIGWLIRKGSPQLKREIDQFAKTHGQGRTLGNSLIKKYAQSARFLTDAKSEEATKRYRQVVDLFRKYSDQYSLDYLLMMAQGYQESRLNQSARSQVGAVGVMQIMPATGAQLGVGDIYKLEPNIHAGVKFIRFLIDQYFTGDSITPLNKTLLAFAAYNAGPGRVERLRAEAASQGLDPNVWRNNVELVAARRIGEETVSYVTNIYRYYVAYTLVQREQDARERELERVREHQAPAGP